MPHLTISVPRLPRWLVVIATTALVVSAHCTPAASLAPNPPDTYPKEARQLDHVLVPDATGYATWLIHAIDRPAVPIAGTRCTSSEIDRVSWNPATGAVMRAPVRVAGGIAAQIATPAGIAFLYNFCGEAAYNVALDRSGPGALTAAIAHPVFQPRMAVLTRESFAIIARDVKTNHLSVDVVTRRGDSLVVDRMPDLTVPTRSDYADVALADGRLMLLGGSDAKYRGCKPCRAETYILDPAARTWSAGPRMLEARSEHSAARLADGSVLVTGGFTPDADWGKGPTASAERLNLSTNAFERFPPMPSGTASHRAIFLPSDHGTALLIAAGTSASIHALDVERRTWRSLGAIWQGSEEGGCAFLPFAHDGNHYVWTSLRTEGFYSSRSCTWDYGLRLASLRFGRAGAPLDERFLITHRGFGAFVPATQSRPALVIGGTVHGGMNDYSPSAAADAFTLDRRATSLPALNTPRAGAYAFRVGTGVLVLGGRGSGAAEPDNAAPPPGAEWLVDETADDARWVKVPNVALDHANVIGPAADGTLLVLGEGGTVARLTLSTTPHPTITTESLPPLRRPRAWGDENARALIHGLGDGRIIVAGGSVQAERIALWRPDADRADAPDEYVPIGEYLPSRRHEIFDPVTRRWHDSAPARAAGGAVAILDDGRVVKIGGLTGKRDELTYLIEMSNAQGTAWTTIGSGSQMRLSPSARPFVIDGELFLSGEYATLNTGGGPSGVEWFDATAGQWRVLWTAGRDDNWRDHVGRVIVRELANGKRVVLPVEGTAP